MSKKNKIHVEINTKQSTMWMDINDYYGGEKMKENFRKLKLIKKLIHEKTNS